MDGNRRYALKNKVDKIRGHEDGLKKLIEVVDWSLYFEVREVTAYAFSIDNFNRSKEEFDNLIKLAKERFTFLTEKGEYFDQKNIRVCFYGNLDILNDKELVNKFRKMEKETEKNKNLKLNICFSYNSTEETYHSIGKINDEIMNKNFDFKINNVDRLTNQTKIINNHDDKQQIVPNFITNYTEEFENNLYGGYNCKPDVVIRTSGEIRLSNFLLYQTRHSLIFFTDKYWPEITFYDYIKILLQYNLCYKQHNKKLILLEKNNN